MAVLERWYLTNTLAGHNKFYEVIIENMQGQYEVRARYGRIGTQGKWNNKYKSTIMTSARRQAENLVNEKLGKGYKRQEGAPVAPPNAPTGKDAPKSISLDRFANLE